MFAFSHFLFVPVLRVADAGLGIEGESCVTLRLALPGARRAMSKQEAVSPFATERARLEGQLQSLEEKRSGHRGGAGNYRRSGAAGGRSDGAGIGASHRGDAAGLRGERPQKRSLVIADVLRDAGRPLTVPEIGRELQRRGDPNDMGRCAT